MSTSPGRRGVFYIRGTMGTVLVVPILTQIQRPGNYHIGQNFDFIGQSHPDIGQSCGFIGHNSQDIGHKSPYIGQSQIPDLKPVICLTLGQPYLFPKKSSYSLSQVFGTIKVSKSNENFYILSHIDRW